MRKNRRRKRRSRRRRWRRERRRTKGRHTKITLILRIRGQDSELHGRYQREGVKIDDEY